MIKVIVADDEEKVAQLICNLVDWGALGMEIVGVAHNGLEALALIEALLPDLVVTDIRMPGCDGLTLISRAKAVCPTLAFIIISGYRHFDYAQNAIKYGVSDYLLKPVKKAELTATLEKMRQSHLQRSQQLSRQQQAQLQLQSDIERLRAGLFVALLTPDTFPGQLDDMNRDYHYNLQPGLFEIALLKLDGDYDTIYTDGLSVMREKVATVVTKALAPLCLDMQQHFTGTTAQILLNYAPAQKDNIRRALRSILDEMRIHNNVFRGAVFTVARGGITPHVGDLPTCHQSARGTLAARLLQGGSGGLLEDPPAPPRLQVRAALQSAAVHSMEAALDIQDSAALDTALLALAGGVRSEERLSGEDILLLCEEMCFTYLLLARNRQIPLANSEMVYDEFRARLDLCSTAAEALECLRQTATITFAAAMRQKGEAEATPIRRAKQHMAAHFMQPITLEQVAEQAGFNPSYFSTLFKKETGQTFSEYLTAIRIDKAKELLRGSAASIAKICEDVGYADVKHFTATFKKRTGIKPGEFRKLYS